MFKKKRFGPSRTACSLHTEEAQCRRQRGGRFQFELMHIGLLLVALFFIGYEWWS